MNTTERMLKAQADALDAIFTAAFNPTVKPAVKICHWDETQINDGECFWTTGCADEYPAETVRYHFCPRCGGEIHRHYLQDDPDPDCDARIADEQARIRDLKQEMP